jgi:universal stress protein A
MNDTIDTVAPRQKLVSRTRQTKFDRILVATDFSPQAARAVEYSAQLAERLGAQLTLLHVVPEPSALEYPMEGIPPEEVVRWQEEAQKQLDEQVEKIKASHPGTDSMQRTAVSPRDEIVKVAAELGADILVLSTHGLTGWKHFLLGSYAEKILEHTSCPTLVVK